MIDNLDPHLLLQCRKFGGLRMALLRPLLSDGNQSNYFKLTQLMD